jgi:hypothetical protein
MVAIGNSTEPFSALDKWSGPVAINEPIRKSGNPKGTAMIQETVEITILPF